MPNAGFPSEDFPALSGFTIDLDEGWFTDPASGMQFAARPRAAFEGFMPNIIGSVKRRRQGVALAGAVEELDRTSGSLKDYAEVGRKDVTVDGNNGFHVEFSYRHAADVTLAQIVTLVEIDRGTCADLVQITSTCAADQVKELWPTLRALHSSLRIVDAPSG